MRSQIKQCFLVVLILTSLATAALQWEFKDDLNIARHCLTGESLNGYVYAIGGVVNPSSPGDAQNAVSKYDPGANTWTLDTSMPTARHSLDSAVVGNYIYAIGGHVANSRSKNERFNGSSWESRAGIYARSSLGVAAYNGEIYAFGGNHYANVQSRFDIYNPLTDTWRYGGEMPAPAEPERALTYNGKIYVPAITLDNTFSGKLWVLDPLTNLWDLSFVPIPNVPRANYELQCVDGRIYTIGGQTASGGAVATVESWAPGETDWRFEPSLNVERAVFASAVIGMDIYVFGGGNSSGDLASTEVLHIPEPVIKATVDIDPDTLNLKSQGRWITCYIELPEGYDVADVDISTIMLNDLVPAESRPTGILDHDGDGVAELMVKFSRSAVQGLLGTVEQAELFVTGELADGTLFEGADTIRVVQ